MIRKDENCTPALGLGRGRPAAPHLRGIKIRLILAEQLGGRRPTAKVLLKITRS
jgi:hypothetical protein